MTATTLTLLEQAKIKTTFAATLSVEKTARQLGLNVLRVRRYLDSSGFRAKINDRVETLTRKG